MWKIINDGKKEIEKLTNNADIYNIDNIRKENNKSPPNSNVLQTNNLHNNLNNLNTEFNNNMNFLNSKDQQLSQQYNNEKKEEEFNIHNNNKAYTVIENPNIDPDNNELNNSTQFEYKDYVLNNTTNNTNNNNTNTNNIHDKPKKRPPINKANKDNKDSKRKFKLFLF